MVSFVSEMIFSCELKMGYQEKVKIISTAIFMKSLIGLLSLKLVKANNTTSQCMLCDTEELSTVTLQRDSRPASDRPLA